MNTGVLKNKYFSDQEILNENIVKFETQNICKKDYLFNINNFNILSENQEDFEFYSETFLEKNQIDYYIYKSIYLNYTIKFI